MTKMGRPPLAKNKERTQVTMMVDSKVKAIAKEEKMSLSDLFFELAEFWKKEGKPPLK